MSHRPSFTALGLPASASTANMIARVTATAPTDASIDAFIDALWLEEGLSGNTLAAYRRDLNLYAAWLAAQGLALPASQGSDISGYFAARHAATKASTANRRLTVFKRYFRWALRERLIMADPTLKLLAARQALRVPKTLSEQQVEALLNAPALDSALGVRDRTMLELMYASGLRVSELITLKVFNLSMADHVLRVLGKGNKERLVPFGEVAGEWLAQYLGSARPELLSGQQTQDLFVSTRGMNAGSAMSRVMFWMIVKKHARGAGITVPLSPHTPAPCLCEPSAQPRR